MILIQRLEECKVSYNDRNGDISVNEEVLTRQARQSLLVPGVEHSHKQNFLDIRLEFPLIESLKIQ